MKYDVIIMGAGPGGYTLALQLGANNKTVLLIEKERFGGSCVNRGCIPTKMLVKHARLLSQLKSADRYSLKIGEVSYDWDKIHQNVLGVSKTLNGAIEGQLTAIKNITIVHGEAKLETKNTVSVEDKTYEGDKIVIATGATSRLLKIKNADVMRQKNRLITSTGGLRLEKLPKSITFIGSGIIGVEFANIYRSLGIEVTLVEMQSAFFGNFDHEVAAQLRSSLENKGIKIHTGVDVREFDDAGNLVCVIDGKPQTFTSDLYFESIGRVVVDKPYSHITWLDRNERNNLKVNNNLQTSEPNIYVLGDTLGTIQLSSVAYKTADMIASHILHGKEQAINYGVTPACIYGPKDFAFVGESEEKLIARKANYKKIILPAAKLPRAHAEIDIQEGVFKILVDNNSNKILGAWIYLNDGSYIINQIAQAMANDLTADQIVKIPFTHPTFNEVLYYALRSYGL
ncbi:dihydrolipoyl dehydrogenase family protein [[Mycoplasma] testudinis]|uniref:dihydrolipoyl dehydrogenase family protein n=1 Tax=[Mycoplasma] testudinis TaxID=33924 RepID=UPI00048A0AE9|nr:FAD-dependent oxidoreductase [[Mycoplasma] testudinis]